MFSKQAYAQMGVTANSIFPWLLFARRLVQSAYLLDRHSIKDDPFKDVRTVACMCIGMAMECYSKAYFVATGNTIHDGKTQKKFGAHDLRRMARDVGFALTDEQEKVLYYLSMYVRIKGRYPVPLNIDDMRIHPGDSLLNPYSEHLLVWNERSTASWRSVAYGSCAIAARSVPWLE